MTVLVCSIDDLGTYQAQLNSDRPCEIYRTTVGSSRGMNMFKNLVFFNPSWQIVMDFREDRIGEEQYRYGYWDEHNGRKVQGYMDILAKNSKQCLVWVKALRADTDYILLCYCSEGRFCHRRVLAEKIKKHRPDLEVIIH